MEPNSCQTGALHHCFQLRPGETTLQPRAKPIKRIISHDVECSLTIRRERKRGDVHTEPFHRARRPRQWPVHARCQPLTDGVPNSERQPAHTSTDDVTCPPQPPEPTGAIVERVIHIHEQRCPWLELSDARLDRGLRIRQMMQYAQAVSEVHLPVRKRHRVDACLVKLHAGHIHEIPPRHVDCASARIDAMKLSHPRSDETRPPPTTATRVESHRIGGKLGPREHGKVGLKQLTKLRIARPALVKATPLLPEPFYSTSINVSHNLLRLLREPPTWPPLRQ